MRSIIISVFLCGILSACAQPTDRTLLSRRKVEKTSSQDLCPLMWKLLKNKKKTPLFSDNSDNEESFTSVCKIREARYTATVKVSGKVSLPAYSQGALPINVSCTFDGKTKQVRLQPENLSRLQRQSSNVGAALLCPICGLGAALQLRARIEKATFMGSVRFQSIPNRLKSDQI